MNINYVKDKKSFLLQYILPFYFKSYALFERTASNSACLSLALSCFERNN